MSQVKESIISERPKKSERRSLLDEVGALHSQGLEMKEACKLVGVQMRKGEQLPTKTPFVPTPAMIVAGRRKIQKTWSPDERRRRRVFLASEWEMSEINTREILSSNR
jgi:hypothetical protein